MRPDAPPAATPVESTPTSPTPEAPKERPRLNLAKRTVSTADPEAGATASATDAKASPFGAARPIDTAAREKEVEEKREVAIREKKEADDKAREEKAKTDAASRNSRADRADRGQAEQDSDKVTSPTSDARKDVRRPSRPVNGTRGPSKENGEVAQQQARPSFKLLRHDPEDGEEVSGAQDASANGNIVDDKATKPQEPVVPAGGAPEAETTAEALEDDGWSTVPAGGKVKNKGRAGGRALAS
jgi:translation initiation factor 4B